MNNPLQILSETLGAKLAEEAIEALNRAGYVCVPRNATPQMIEDGWAAANEENAENTWHDMVASALESQSAITL